MHASYPSKALRLQFLFKIEDTTLVSEFVLHSTGFYYTYLIVTIYRSERLSPLPFLSKKLKQQTPLVPDSEKYNKLAISKKQKTLKSGTNLYIQIYAGYKKNRNAFVKFS